MDKNTTIGFLLLGGLLIALFAINSKNRLSYEAEQKRISDSIASIKKITSKDEVAIRKNQVQQNVLTPLSDSSLAVKETTLENDVLKIIFSNKGAQPVRVELKKFKTFDNKPVTLQQGNESKLEYKYNTGNQKSASILETVFETLPVLQNADKSKTLSFVISDSTGKKITHRYTLSPNNYMVAVEFEYEGSDRLFNQPSINLSWDLIADGIEKDHKYETTQTHLCFSSDNKYDFEYISKGGDLSFPDQVDWIGVKRQFFINAWVPKEKFTSVRSVWSLPNDTADQYINKTQTTGQLSLSGSGDRRQATMQWYFGPSDYNILKQYDNHMEYMVPLGSGVFAFVKYINRYFLLPVFDFLCNNIANMGIVILLITLIIRLITSPILYKSYLSGAKMKVLKPEVDALKEKYKDDQQTFAMEQMKLWKTAGVSPLGGCLPALLQIPIFMSLYYFFQANIGLRGKPFLWTNDLSAYDSIAHFSFNIPFYGDHVSLFTLTAVITSLLISIFSMSNMQDNSNPMMKYMPYIFPVLLLGIFNSLPAALTWYYTVSNTITLLFQWVIQKFIINHEKIMVEIEENRKKPVKKSKMQERIEAMQESQKKLKELGKK